MNIRKNIFDEIGDIERGLDAGQIGDSDIGLDLKPIMEGELIVGELTRRETALFIYQEQLIDQMIDLVEMDVADEGCEELHEALKKRGELVEGLLWDCILTRFSGEDPTTLEIRIGFQIVKTGNKIIPYLNGIQSTKQLLH